MSSLRNAVSRKAHKERAQPHDRRKYGLLEKHKDYVKLKEKAAFRNPDEFYFKMINTKVTDGVHRTRPEILANRYSQEELMLMKTQDAGYILQKVQSERKKVEKLSSVLHSLDTDLKNKHIYFAEDREEAKELQSKASQSSRKSTFDHVPGRIRRKMEGSYRELEERKKRVNHLGKLYSDMVLQKELQKKGRKRKLREDEIICPTTRPVYKWRSERKR
ncbi:hypothetical protein Taro_019919 [Colocasia esculenta]|uniref:U3 small nucleolar RNA-associated protein 11 n=1 Tax=Colocasia esculenta TaxID=4460 RepID=A0A843UUU7_COLES|nr:hypothetical protein [Colocasia esculenta]